MPVVGGDVLGQPEREARLPHAGAGGEDHQVRPLQAVQLLVDLVEAGGHTDQLAVVAVARLELVERVLQRVADADHRVGDAPLGDLEHERLGAVEGLGDVVGLVVAHLGDVAGDADEPAQQRELVDDARVVTRVGRRRRVALDLQQRGATADVVEQVGAAQLLGDGDRVGRLALTVQRLDGLVDVAVRGLVEVAGLDVRLDRRGDRVAREEHRPEQRLLGLEVVRRDAATRAPTHRIDRLDHCRSPPPHYARTALCAPATGFGRGTTLWVTWGEPLRRPQGCGSSELTPWTVHRGCDSQGGREPLCSRRR